MRRGCLPDCLFHATPAYCILYHLNSYLVPPRVEIETLQLFILLGLRSGELRQAQWQHLDTGARTLTIPVENQKLLPKQIKAARPFVVPLDDFALDLFQ